MAFLLFLNIIFAQSEITIKSNDITVKANRIFQADDGVWGMDFLNDKEMILTLKNGEVYVLNLKTLIKKKISHSLSSVVIGQGGLLDVKVDTDYQKNKKVYFTHAYRTGSNTYTTVLVESILENDRLVQIKELFTAVPSFSDRVHFGSRIHVDPKYIFITVGDRGNRDLAQDLSTHMGKVIRIHKDGSIPSDNPFVGQKNAKGEIWSYGHRNPQGMYFYEGKLYISEHGPRGGDEINLIEKGKNYGWPKITYGREYHGPKIGETQAPGMEQPMYQFTPSIGPSGLVVYSGKKMSSWKGSFFSGALALMHLNRLYKVGGQWKEERLLSASPKRVRNVKEDTQGALYFSTDTGEIYRIF